MSGRLKSRPGCSLSRPEGALNAGAVCRAMKSMGLKGLSIREARHMEKVFRKLQYLKSDGSSS